MQRGCRRHHTTANLKTAVWSPFGTRPECGTRGISHPRNGRVPEGAPPTIRCAAGVPGGRWGSVVYGWRGPPTPCLFVAFAFLINSMHNARDCRPPKMADEKPASASSGRCDAVDLTGRI